MLEAFKIGFRVIYVVYLINKLLQGSSSRPDECDTQVEGRGQLPSRVNVQARKPLLTQGALEPTGGKNHRSKR
jgi:hypothetical protein